MSKMDVVQQAKASSLLSSAQGMIQRKCACGNQTIAGGVCAECARKTSKLQRKLTIDSSNDPLEREADKVADQVIKMPTHSNVGNIPLYIQRVTSQFPHQIDSAPSSVERVISSSGRPLNPALRQDMESRFGHDFSRVQVHTDTWAAESASAVNAQAYTVGRDVVFGSGQYAPETHAGKSLLAHELTHVVQQTGQLTQHKEHRRISRAPNKRIQRKIQNVQQAELVTFFSQPEPMIPQHLRSKYLVESTLMSTQRKVIKTLISRVQTGKAPLSADELKTLVLNKYESNIGTALIICHNVTKALARGNSPINWSNVRRDPDLVYSLDGSNYTFNPDRFHHKADPRSSKNKKSVFYAMLSPTQFGIRDEGDWYHYYAIAAASYYRASGNFQTHKPGRLDPQTKLTGTVVSRVVNALRDNSVTRSAAYESWLLANAMSFLEGGFYGGSQHEVTEESKIHIQGASGGLESEGRIPEENWQWYVPRAKSITDLSNFQLRGNIIATTWKKIHGDFQLIIIRGTTPNHWLDTPDPYVKIKTPGLLGLGIFGDYQTSTKDDTTSPVWNETLTNLPYNSLSSVTLQLYDEDSVSDDSITNFTADLRPKGKRSRNFILESGGSTLDVRVKAAGRVVLV